MGSDGIDTLNPCVDFSEQSKYFFSYSYWNVPQEHFNTDFTVTPYFVTLDGTKVCGVTRTRIVSESYSPNGIPDFIIEVEETKDPVVLQLTDTQIIDATQERYASRLGADSEAYWGKDKLEERCYGYIRETIMKTNPDLILITGDVIYGEFDDAGTSLRSFVEFMDSFEIPWAPVFGNHDNESAKGADWQCEQFEQAEYCLFKQRELTGNGNYTVGIVQGNKLQRVFFMLDSNGCGGASEASLANGHTVTTSGFGDDQILWYTDTAERIAVASPNTKFSFAFHIQLAIFAEAYEKYGFDNATTYDNPIHIDRLSDKSEDDFGYLGRDLKGAWDKSYKVWNGLKELGVDSIFVGHEHCNSASVVYEGVRFQYGQKIGTYDRANFVESDGTIVGMYLGDADGSRIPLMGGTVIPLSSEDGSISNPYIYLCENAGGNIDWDSFEKEELIVNGLQYGTDLTKESVINVSADTIAGENAWKCEAVQQGKVFINKELLKNKSKVTFSVYLPASSNITLGGLGEMAIRVKPNDLEPVIDGVTDGYIHYDTDSNNTLLKLVYGEWKTYTIDISGFGESCTELSFVIAKGNTIYLKDLMIE